MISITLPSNLVFISRMLVFFFLLQIKIHVLMKEKKIIKEELSKK
jgi:hypothetical protein